jgi:hypothetical protein
MVAIVILVCHIRLKRWRNGGAQLLSDRDYSADRQHAIDSDSSTGSPVIVVDRYLNIKHGPASTPVGVLQ